MLVCAAAVAIVLSWSTTRADGPPVPPADASSGVDTDLVLATAGSARIRESDVASAAKDDFAALDAEYRAEQDRLREQFERARRKLLARSLDKVLDQRALAAEMAATGEDEARILARERPQPVTESDIKTFFEHRIERTGKSLDEVKLPIRAMLEQEHGDRARRRVLDELRARHGFVPTAPPERVAVAATGPSRGPANAPVTLIEFADLQCPFCADLRPTLAKLSREYPDQLRIIFRHFPLDSIHPQAARAAAATVCAEEEGRFWPLHDAVFENPALLANGRFGELAAAAGLDGKSLERCIASDRAAKRVAADVADATKLGILGTPTLFVNGRRYTGSVPFNELARVVDEEIRLARAAR